MPFFTPASNCTLTEITNSMGGAINQQESQITSTLSQIQNNPDVSPSQLVVFQANLQLWSNLIQMESSIVKVYGDTMKQVVNNMGE